MGTWQDLALAAIAQFQAGEADGAVKRFAEAIAHAGSSRAPIAYLASGESGWLTGEVLAVSGGVR